MKEALRLTAPGKLDYESEAVRELKEALKIPEMDHDKWIELPRRYSRSSARFGLPMDTRELMSELQHTTLNANERRNLTVFDFRNDSSSIPWPSRFCP